MKKFIFLFTLCFGFNTFADQREMVRCQGGGYSFTLMANDYTFATDASLLTPKGQSIEMSCSIYTGQENSSWSCSEVGHEKVKFNVVIFGAEWEESISAQLNLGSKIISNLDCEAVSITR